MTQSVPDVHFKSLERIEVTYWWNLSRVDWAEWFLHKHVADLSERHALDFGCGTGGFIYMLNKRIRFRSCMGVDISAKALDAARKFGDNYKLIVPGEFSSAEGKDMVFLMDTLEHIENDTEFLQQLFKPLRAGAVVLISVPAVPRLYSSWDRALGHYRRYSKDHLCRVVSKSGGRVTSIRYVLSYAIPGIVFRRIWQTEKFDSSNCEFPAVSDFLNKTLRSLNRLEISVANWYEAPIGSSLMCLVEI